MKVHLLCLYVTKSKIPSVSQLPVLTINLFQYLGMLAVLSISGFSRKLPNL